MIDRGVEVAGGGRSYTLGTILADLHDGPELKPSEFHRLAEFVMRANVWCHNPLSSPPSYFRHHYVVFDGFRGGKWERHPGAVLSAVIPEAEWDPKYETEWSQHDEAALEDLRRNIPRLTAGFERIRPLVAA